MTTDDLKELKMNETLIWHKPASTSHEAVEYLYPVEDAQHAAKGRIWVRLYNGRLRTINIRNCTRPTP